MHQVNVHIDRPDSSLVDRLKRVHFQAALIGAELERAHKSAPEISGAVAVFSTKSYFVATLIGMEYPPPSPFGKS